MVEKVKSNFFTNGNFLFVNDLVKFYKMDDEFKGWVSQTNKNLKVKGVKKNDLANYLKNKDILFQIAYSSASFGARKFIFQFY